VLYEYNNENKIAMNDDDSGDDCGYDDDD